MNNIEFDTEFKSLARCFGKIDMPAEMQLEYWNRFKDIEISDFKAICERAKDTLERFPSRKQLIELCAVKGISSSPIDAQPVEMISVECVCGMSFTVRSTDLSGFGTFFCPGNDYPRPGSSARFCTRKFDAGFLRLCKRATNGAVYIKDNPQPEERFPSFVQYRNVYEPATVEEDF